jgi:hypothetical protein
MHASRRRQTPLSKRSQTPCATPFQDCLADLVERILVLKKKNPRHARVVLAASDKLLRHYGVALFIGGPTLHAICALLKAL